MKKFLKHTVCIYTIMILTIATNSHAAGDDLLSVDRTIIFQFVIVIFALYILNLLMFKPLLELLDKRKQLTTGSIEEAKELMEKTEKLIEKYNKAIEEARNTANEQRMEMRQQAQQTAEKLIHEARQEAQAVVEKYKNDLEDQIKNAKEKIKPQVDNLANDICSKIISGEG